MLTKVRIDKWLWSVRLFKSRSLATDACKSGKVKIGNEAVKPSYMVTIGEIIDVKKDGFNYKYKVVELLDKRVGAKIAEPCYENLTSEDEMNKYKAWYNNQAANFEFRARGDGRPTKKERREIDRFKTDEDDEDED
jgi:ribosome-associated heat shock protein Hsp15